MVQQMDSPPRSEATLPASPPQTKMLPPPSTPPKVPLSNAGLFSGTGAPAASATITGYSAELLLQTTRKNIAHRLQLQQMQSLPTAAWKTLAKDHGDRDPKMTCPSWDGQNPAQTLRGWMRQQLF